LAAGTPLAGRVEAAAAAAAQAMRDFATWLVGDHATPFPADPPSPPGRAPPAPPAQAMRDFATWLVGDHATRFPDDAPFAIGEAAQARKLREVHCFDTTPAEFTRTGRSHIEELTAALTEQAAKLAGPGGTGGTGGTGGGPDW